MSRSDRAIRILTTLAVLVVAAIAAVVSYSHIYGLGRADGTAARLLPVSVDGLILAASLVLLHEACNGRDAPRLARFMLWLGIAATIGANIAHGAAYGLLGALISAWPAVAFIGCVEMAIGMIRRSRTAPAVTVADDLAETVYQAPEVVSETVAAEGVPGPVADDAAEGAVTPQVRAAGRTVARRPTRRHTPEQRAERVFAGHLAEGRLPSLRSLIADLHLGQDRARQVRQHLASLVSAEGGEAA